MGLLSHIYIVHKLFKSDAIDDSNVTVAHWKAFERRKRKREAIK